jgi:cell division septation protein DedD
LEEQSSEKTMELDEPKKRGGGFFLALLIGIALGVAGTILVPRWAAPHLPGLFRGGESVGGQVLDKASEPDRLLLKVTTEQGVFLATFTQRQKEIDLLVDPGDTITVNVRRYEPFLENPAIEAVRKPELSSTPEKPSVESETPEAIEPPMEKEEPQAGEPEAIEPAMEPGEEKTPGTQG